MMLNKKIILCIICMNTQLYGLDNSDLQNSDDARFLAKDRENTLKILEYKATIEAKKEQEELERIKQEEELKRKQQEEELKKKRLLSKLEKEQLKQQEEEEQKANLQRQLKEQEEQAKEKQRQQEEALRKRVSKYKLVLAGEKDRVNLKKDLENNFYMEDYAELGTPQDITSSMVNRDNIATTDMYVRLLTETNINSRRAGEFVAISEKDVFSFDSNAILIPRGSKFICNFEPLNAYGESALIAECKRVYFPNGKSMLITSSILNDTMGRAGIVGELDNRMWEKYGQTFSLSLLSGLAIMGSDKLPTSGTASLAQYTALNVLDLSTKFLEKTIDLAPVITIPSGSRLILKLAVDVNLQPIVD